MATRPISLLPFEKAPHILVRNALQILLVMAMIAATLIVLPSRRKRAFLCHSRKASMGIRGRRTRY